MDRKKVIKGLEWILDGDRFGFGENWHIDSEPKTEEEQAGFYIQRAIELLKEQEAVKPVEVNNKETGCFKCGNCGAVVLSYSYPGIITDKHRSYHQFCGKCGRRVSWEGL